MQEEMSFIAQKVEATCARGKKRKWLEIVKKIIEKEKERKKKTLKPEFLWCEQAHTFDAPK